jgi:hypothetical protein
MAAASTYYVRKGSQIHGPFDAEKLKRLAIAGQITRDDFVSRDRAQWTPAGNVNGLFPPAELIVTERPTAIPTVHAPPPPPMATAVPAPQVVYVQSQPAHVTQRVVVNVTHRGNTCAVAAALFGFLALAFCWIPFLGLFTIPLALLAIVLAAVGLLVAVSRDGAGVAASVCGGVVAVLAIAGSLISTTAAVGAGAAAAAGAASEAAQPADPQ